MEHNNDAPLVTVLDVCSLALILARNRGWHYNQQVKTHVPYSIQYTHPRNGLHPCVYKAFELARPKDWHLVVLEWPHVAQTDPTRLAYTQNERKGESDLQTLTAIGKYLKRHWPMLADNVIRDITEAFIVTQQASCKFVPDDVDCYIEVVQNGPTSCMKWDEDDLEDFAGPHPYSVYTPELGWRMAVRLNAHGQFAARALVYTGERAQGGNQPVYVRSYRAENDNPHNGGYSYADDKLEAWLKQQGVEKRCSWPVGTRFAKIRVGHCFVMPYLDGDAQRVDEEGKYLCRAERGTYACVDTGGYAEDDGEGGGTECDVCHTTVDDDDITYVEYEQRDVCACCLSRHYTHTTHSRWVRDVDVEIATDGTTWRAGDEAPDDYIYVDNGYHSGSYAPLDDAVCDTNDEWWHVDDIVRRPSYDSNKVVWLCDDSKYAGEYAPEEDCYYVESEGVWVHEDDVEEEETFVLLVDGGVVRIEDADKGADGEWVRAGEYEGDEDEGDEDEGDEDDEPASPVVCKDDLRDSEFHDAHVEAYHKHYEASFFTIPASIACPVEHRSFRSIDFTNGRGAAITDQAAITASALDANYAALEERALAWEAFSHPVEHHLGAEHALHDQHVKDAGAESLQFARNYGTTTGRVEHNVQGFFAREVHNRLMREIQNFAGSRPFTIIMDDISMHSPTVSIGSRDDIVEPLPICGGR